MKKTILLLVVSVMSLVPVIGATATSAWGENPSIEINLQADDFSNSAHFQFDSFEHMELFDLSVIEELMPSNLEDCSVTATVTVSHTLGMEGNVGVASTGHQTTITVSATVTASCSEIKSVIKSLIADLRAQLGLG